MQIVVSPYHLTTREAPALAALLLGRGVATLLPAPLAADGRADWAGPREAARRVPLFGRFVQSWAWTVPLWKAGVLAADLDGENAVEDMWAVWEHIGRDAAYLPLRTFLRQECYEDQHSYLGAVAADLLKGGPDPGICVPVNAAMDRFATRRGLLVARGRAASLSQRAEAGLGRTLLSWASPVFVQASAERLLHAREIMKDELARLWSAADAALAGVCDTGESPVVGRVESAELNQAAGELTQAFASRRGEILEGSGEDEVRAVEGTATITAVCLPWDAVLTSSVRAMETLVPVPVRAPPAEDRQKVVTQTLPVVYDGVSGRSFVALIIKTLGASPQAPTGT